MMGVCLFWTHPQTIQKYSSVSVAMFLLNQDLTAIDDVQTFGK